MCSLLVLDDLGTQNATTWAAGKTLPDHQLPLHQQTADRGDHQPRPGGDLDDRIRSRLQDPDLVTTVRITAPDYRSPVKASSATAASTSCSYCQTAHFGNFSLREAEKLSPEVHANLEKVFRAAQEFAEHPRGWLVLTGTYGCGKTHLAAAIGNYRKGMGDDPVFVVVPDLLDHLRATFSPTSGTSYDDLFNRVKSRADPHPG